MLADQPAAFVDFYSPEDLYPAQLLTAMAADLEKLSRVDSLELPGERWAKAPSPLKRVLCGAPFVSFGDDFWWLFGVVRGLLGVVWDRLGPFRAMRNSLGTVWGQFLIQDT